jgi:hypothetical protein
MPPRIIAFTYSADHYCDDCLTKKLLQDSVNRRYRVSGDTGDIAANCPAWFNSLDSEGNMVGAVYDYMEWWEPSITDRIQYLSCGDCETILDTYTPEGLYDASST